MITSLQIFLAFKFGVDISGWLALVLPLGYFPIIIQITGSSVSFYLCLTFPVCFWPHSQCVMQNFHPAPKWQYLTAPAAEL